MKTLKFKKVTTVDYDIFSLDNMPSERTMHPNETLEIEGIEETPGRSYVDIWLEDGTCLLDVPKDSFEIVENIS